MSLNEQYSNHITAAVQKFYTLNDNMDDVQAVTRKVFFEFLRTKPQLSTEEIDTLHTVYNLLAELSTAKRVAAQS